MNQSTNYDPPETVVPIAFRELLERLRRARITSPKPSDITDEERKAFEYGVQQRKRVLEHTLCLVFGQWALYRQAVSKLQSRALRLLYAAGSVMSTVSFVRHRASHVSADMFAHIVTTGVDSPLGNEARIVLAELEGPDGPYFRHVCRERGFETDLYAVVAGMEEGGDPVHDVHPQLRLRPRLMSESQVAPHPLIVKRGDMRRDGRHEREPVRRNERQMRPSAPMQKSEEQRRNMDRREEWDAVGIDTGRLSLPEQSYRGEQATNSPDGFQTVEGRERMVVKARERKRVVTSGEPVEQDVKQDLWGRPFDFAKAASASWENQDEETIYTEDKSKLTPSQRRAAERRERRMRARARLEAEDEAASERFAGRGE